MMGNWRNRVTAFAAVLTMAAAGVAHATDVKSLRVWAGKTHTRAVLDLSGPLHYQLFQLKHPGRIVLDLDQSALPSSFVAPDASGLLKGIRTGRHGKDGVRVVFDLAAATVKPRSFLLKPDGKDGYRLVVDVYPEAAAAHPTEPAQEHQQQLQRQRDVVIAIDAGHGGVDPGAHGPDGTLEKNITLKVAKDLARLVNAQPGMTAVLTRDDDTFIPLKRRYQIARQHNADLFISIHADAFRNSDARGSSVWVLSPPGKTSEAARWLANGQNRADLIGGVSLDDKDHTLAAVLLDLQQGYAMKASDIVARNVLKGLAKLGPTHRGYVEKADFVVLRSPDVPSILVETAFITNPHEERKLRSARHRQKLAEAILDGVRNYFTKTPPPGTLFAALAAKRHGEPAASSHASLVLAQATTPTQHGPSADSAIDADVQDMHRVSSGETLSGIAHQYGVSVPAIKEANSMTTDTVRIGSILAIPTG